MWNLTWCGCWFCEYRHSSGPDTLLQSLTLLQLGGRKGIRPVKNCVLGCWRGYLSGARYRFAYIPADWSTATHCFLLQEIQIGFGFTFLILADPGRPGKNPESHRTVVVVVVVVVVVQSWHFCSAASGFSGVIVHEKMHLVHSYLVKLKYLNFFGWTIQSWKIADIALQYPCC